MPRTVIAPLRAAKHSAGLAQGSHGSARNLRDTQASVVGRDCARVYAPGRVVQGKAGAPRLRGADRAHNAASCSVREAHGA